MCVCVYAYLCIYHRQRRSGDKSLRIPGCFGPNLRFPWFSVVQWDQAYIQIRTVAIILFPSSVSGIIKHIYTLVIYMHYVYVYMYMLHCMYICVYTTDRKDQETNHCVHQGVLVPILDLYDSHRCSVGPSLHPNPDSHNYFVPERRERCN